MGRKEPPRFRVAPARAVTGKIGDRAGAIEEIDSVKIEEQKDEYRVVDRKGN